MTEETLKKATELQTAINSIISHLAKTNEHLEDPKYEVAALFLRIVTLQKGSPYTRSMELDAYGSYPSNLKAIVREELMTAYDRIASKFTKEAKKLQKELDSL